MEKDIYRILDANLNRAREGLRVVEDYVRFVRDDRRSSERLKSWRHGLRQIVEKLGRENLLSARSADTDVGKDLPSPSLSSKSDPHTVATASLKRIQEALRVIEEYSISLETEASNIASNMRFEVYQFEQDLLADEPRTKFEKVRLYLLIGSDFCPADKMVDVSASLLDAGVDCLQLREKHLPDKELYLLAEKLAHLCKEKKKIFIVNDRVDIAQAVNADGVHLGQNDLPKSSASKILGPDRIIGLSTHNIQELYDAIELKPTYIAIGPAFPTTTKPHVPAAGLEYISTALTELQKAHIPEVAIGGITIENLDQLLTIGVKRIALASGILSAKNPTQQTRAFAKFL